ncbi:PQQ-dependent sugar dehydrogenase [Limnoglobus roseus]|uniref:Putative glucose/L-sorbosone dehydrogenase, distantly related to bacterial beta-galactosidase n=1 Tax=Limnoglobus roseus TaxID=2598579 RepID=A0A5C1A774_9BACT|nr:PQQ-dependent sugar dehydrogenase [Limnoglobus roseus]QEL14123.1 putative glucose/L-sorbosone dehydrogenase, distantly related to bacterial beta-galactosidase [Limnoglobus roseus]
MKRLSVLFLLASAATATAAPPPPIVSGLKMPESVVVTEGRTFVTTFGERDKDGDGQVVEIKDGQAVPFATGLDDPKGIVAYNKAFYVADKTRVWKIGRDGKASVYVAADQFPTPPIYLNDIAVEERSGSIFVTDTGDKMGAGGAVYQFNARGPKAGKVRTVVDKKSMPSLHSPNGVATDGESFILLADMGTGTLYRVKVADGSADKVADGFGGADGIAWDNYGRLFVSDVKGGRVFGIPRPGEKPVLIAEGFQSAADIRVTPDGKNILVPDLRGGTLTLIPTTIPGWEVDESPLPIRAELAFPKLKWTGWSNTDDAGRSVALRPIVLTHANDASNRVFVATEHGVIHTFPNDQNATETKVFLDIQDRVLYNDKQNEEGFLGLAFHPKYKQNGEFFVFYTPKKEKMVNVISRFRVSKDDPNKADPASEEEILRFKKPFWNHNGGTLAFGPDGYLYTNHGDGGDGGDPFGNAQNLNVLLGKILRLDIDHKDEGKNYAIPKDNPFAGQSDKKGEIWAYGLRNVWRFAFDRKSGQLWAGDVGQNLFEEINIIDRGGNYGWNPRESLHPFGPKAVGVNPAMIEPIWEYHHDVGKSITGGTVYRGPKLPELDGHYLYGDYVSNKLWALKYDPAKKRVVANRPLKDAGQPMLSFGEDEKGEVYWLTTSNKGQGIYWFAK